MANIKKTSKKAAPASKKAPGRPAKAKAAVKTTSKSANTKAAKPAKAAKTVKATKTAAKPAVKKTAAKAAPKRAIPAPKRALGKGLEAMLSVNGIPASSGDSVVELKINDISPNEDQPRKNFNDEKIDQLAASIAESGVIQPIIVQKRANGYRIVAGERRWRAARQAGLTVIPAIIRDLTDKETLEQALIENIVREDLNPIEEAYAMQNLLKAHKLTQDKLAKELGKPRATIANTLRLINLDESIQEFIKHGDLSEGHAKVILSLKDKDEQRRAADVILQKEMNVRQAEAYVKKIIEAKENPAVSGPVELPDERVVLSVKEYETKLKKQLGSRVKLKLSDRSVGKGKIVIEYKDYDDLDRLISILG
ncbi:MAG: ParB/RepB/Spo0J family partition protein [Saccharofermentans sp.]|nr:ParB/RepB/Spo0J family partition protein [Saccharofermentans sp.]